MDVREYLNILHVAECITEHIAEYITECIAEYSLSDTKLSVCQI